MPLVPVLARIERQGALVDANLLGLQSASWVRRWSRWSVRRSDCR